MASSLASEKALVFDALLCSSPGIFRIVKRRDEERVK